MQAWLIDGAVSHSSSGATQTCGYRCTQMLLSHVLSRDGDSGWPGSRSRLGPLPPSVDSLRRTLEEAWRAGYDPSGAEQLGHSTVKRQRRRVLNNAGEARARNSAGAEVINGGPGPVPAEKLKWIGGTEIWVLLTYLGLSARLVDFAIPSAFTPASGAPPPPEAQTPTPPYPLHPPASPPPAGRPAREVFSWLWGYFTAHPTSGGPGWPRRSSAPPAVLQYSGHSVVVIGAVRWRRPAGGEERRLVILDPGLGPADLKAQMAGGGLGRVGLLIEAHDRDAYQLVTVTAGWREGRAPREPDDCTFACVCGV